MTNFEKYKDVLKKMADEGTTLALVKGRPVACCHDTCANCDWHGEPCDLKGFQWLLAEYKEPIKLSPFAKEYLKKAASAREYKYIARDYNGILYLYRVKPERCGGYWHSTIPTWVVEDWEDDFSFVKSEDAEPWSIEELLKGAELDESKPMTLYSF